MEKLKMSPPWIEFVHEVEALFKDDSEVKLVYDNNEYSLKLYVDDNDKAMALSKIIPEKKEFGKIIVTITIIPANMDDYSIDKIFAKAFEGNPAMSRAVSFDTLFGKTNYVVFKKEVVQFYNDQMNDINGNKSMLYQDIANDVFSNDLNVFYCTETDEKMQKPLG